MSGRNIRATILYNDESLIVYSRAKGRVPPLLASVIRNDIVVGGDTYLVSG